MQVIG
jgi:hypothetical protein